MMLLKKTGLLALAGAMVVLLTPMAALADHDFKLFNKGDHQIDHVYLSNVDADDWGSDQLSADEVVESGQHISWTIGDGCLQDVKVIYHNGHKDVERNFDTCKYDLELSY